MKEPSTITLHELLTDFYAPLRGISARTVKIYGFTLGAWGQFLGTTPTVEHLEELTVARFLSHRLTQKSVGTAAKDRAQIHALWEFAARRGLTGPRWPQIRSIRSPERVPQCWLADEMVSLLAAASAREGHIAGVPAGRWWRAAVLTAYESGCRIGELLGVRWADVSPSGVLFRAENRKGGRRDIYRPISPACYEAIDATRTPRCYVWEWDRCYTNLWRHLGVICAAAGLPDDRMSKFHRIRKTTASFAAAGGVDAQRLLDHASPTTTRRYLDPRVVVTPSAIDVLPKIG
jgi:integrase